MTVDRAALLAVAEPIAREVGDVLRASLLDEGPVIRTKSTSTDLVTDLDVWSEHQIVTHIRSARPDDGIEGEEGASVAGTSGVTWSIDPIDGTVNFVHHLPGFNVSIAALVDGEAVAGVVVDPLAGEVFSATKGGGSHCNGRAIRCASPSSLGRALVATGFAYDPPRRRRQAEVLARVIGDIADVRRLGAAATDLCHVAAGRVDAYWEVGLNRWDHSAGGLVATEAGARFGGLDGGPGSSDFVLAAAPEIWDELAELLRAAGADQV